MLEFKIIETLKPNTEILEVIKDFTYKVKNPKVVKYILKLILQHINHAAKPDRYFIIGMPQNTHNYPIMN